jgi:hypothetical protein
MCRNGGTAVQRGVGYNTANPSARPATTLTRPLSLRAFVISATNLDRASRRGSGSGACPRKTISNGAFSLLMSLLDYRIFAHSAARHE